MSVRYVMSRLKSYERNWRSNFKKRKTHTDRPLKHEIADKPLKDEELSAVTGGLNGSYADVTLPGQDEELENAKEKGGCGKP